VIPAYVVTRLVLHLDRDDAVSITRIPLLDPRGLLLEACDRDGRQVARLVQGRRKRKIDLVPWREISGRGTRVRDLAAFEIAKMADVVRWLISAGGGGGRAGPRRAAPGLWQRPTTRRHAGRPPLPPPPQ